jgi:hypothetical protein
MAANGIGSSGQPAAAATPTTPSNDELKEAIKQFKAENPDSTFKLVLNFVRSEKTWVVSEARLRKVMVELGFLQNRDEESYLEGRMESLLDSGTGDVSFIVGPSREVVKAHKVIVYHNCPSLLESYPLKGDNTVDVPEINPESFKVFTRFLYIARVRQATVQVAKDLLLLAKKVGDERLCGMCVDMIASQLDVNNVCDVFCLCSSLQPDTHGHVSRLRQLCGGVFHSHQKEVPTIVASHFAQFLRTPRPYSVQWSSSHRQTPPGVCAGCRGRTHAAHRFLSPERDPAGASYGGLRPAARGHAQGPHARRVRRAHTHSCTRARAHVRARGAHTCARAL